jgi:DNA-binding MarR family transcriptional regulator
MHDGDGARGAARHADETRWLSAAEMRAWLAFWGAMHLVDAAIDRDLQERSGLSHGAYQILALLSAAPGHRLRMSALAEVVFVSRSRLTYQVTQLEMAGLVRREECPSDKRGAVAVLTERGMEVLRAAAPGHVACVRRVFFDALTPEQVAVLGDALSAVRDHLLGETERHLLTALGASAS